MSTKNSKDLIRDLIKEELILYKQKQINESFVGVAMLAALGAVITKVVTSVMKDYSQNIQSGQKATSEASMKYLSNLMKTSFLSDPRVTSQIESYKSLKTPEDKEKIKTEIFRLIKSTLENKFNIEPRDSSKISYIVVTDLFR